MAVFWEASSQTKNENASISYEEMRNEEKLVEIARITTMILRCDSEDIKNHDIVEQCKNSWNEMLKLHWFKDVQPEFATFSDLVVQKYPVLIEDTVFKSVMIHLEKENKFDDVGSFLFNGWPTISPLIFQAVVSILNTIYLSSRCKKISDIIIRFVEAVKSYTGGVYGSVWKLYPKEYWILVKALLYDTDNRVGKSVQESRKLKIVILNEIKLLTLQANTDVNVVLQHFSKWKDFQISVFSKWKDFQISVFSEGKELSA